MDNEKPFKCPRCSLCFATSDHLVVHQRVHARENRNLLVKMPTGSSENASDQTPTPTRFLKTADVDGGAVLFEDINPFDHDFKLATKRNSSPAATTSTEQGSLITSVYMEKTKPFHNNCEIISSHNESFQSKEEKGVNSLTEKKQVASMDSPYNSAIHRQVNSSTLEERFKEYTSIKCLESDYSISKENSNIYTVTSDESSSLQQSLNSHFSKNGKTAQTQTSLQSLLQQIQKQTNTAESLTKNVGALSQEALREQLKSLIKSGQIKIKFTSDPSSPKVQATIVGNIAKKTTVIPRTNMPEQTVCKLSSESQQKGQSQNLVIPHKSLQEKVLVSEAIHLGLVQKQLSPKIPISHKTLPNPLNTLRFKQKPILQKPIPIAPKEVSTSENSVPLASKLVLCSSTISNTWSLPSVSSSSQTHFSKVKMNHILRQNTSVDLPMNGQDSDSNSQDLIENDSIITSEYDNLKQGRKQKGRLVDDCPPEEKRQRFLERNRAAASRCRQKRKIWVNQLESKSDDLLQTNNLLLNEINALRSEVAQLKALLLAHKDCPVTVQQKALLGQMTPGSYVAAVSDGQIIAIHQVPNDSTHASSAEEVATSALTDMAERASVELGTPTQRSENTQCNSSCGSSS